MPTVQASLPVTRIDGLKYLIPELVGRMRHKVLVISNGKGGVGKSSLAAALAVLLTLVGKRVLLVEMDPQGNNAEDLGFIGTPLYDGGRAQVDALLEGTALTPTGEARPGLWVLPGGQRLEGLIEELYIQQRKGQLADDPTWLYMYAAAIAQVAPQFDEIILDVAPGCMPLQLQAMVAGDMVLVPSRSDESSRKGLRTVARRIVEAQPYNPSLRLLGIVLFGVTAGSTRTGISAGIRRLLQQDVEGVAPVLDSVIRYSERSAVECRRAGKIPHELAVSDDIDPALKKALSALAKDYRALLREYMTRAADLHHSARAAS